jgi:hypothetical protein
MENVNENYSIGHEEAEAIAQHLIDDQNYEVPEWEELGDEEAERQFTQNIINDLSFTTVEDIRFLLLRDYDCMVTIEDIVLIIQEYHGC